MTDDLAKILEEVPGSMKKAMDFFESELVKIRAGKANLFLSPLFLEAFVNATGVPVELYQNDGSVGAALGSGHQLDFILGAMLFGWPWLRMRPRENC